MPKKRTISEELLQEAAQKYIVDKKDNNIARLSKRYGIPYSTLRRYLLTFIDENNLSDSLVEDYLPFEGFEYLKIGDTYQYATHLTLWLVKDVKKIDGDKVYILVPTVTFSDRHWICDVLYLPEQRRAFNV